MKKLRKKIILSSSLAVMLAGSIVPSVAVFADSNASSQTAQSVLIENGEEVRYVSNEEFLTALKTVDPEAYAKIPSEVVTSMLRQDWFRQGTTKITRNRNGFKIYLNSAIVKTFKYTGISVGTAVGLLAAAGITAGTAGVGSAAFGGVAAAVVAASTQANASKGIIISFSKKGSLVSWKQQ